MAYFSVLMFQALLERNEDLESCLRTAQNSREALQQQADQLRHDVSLKEQLLRLYIRHANEADLTDNSPNLNHHPFFEDEWVCVSKQVVTGTEIIIMWLPFQIWKGDVDSVLGDV